MTDELMMKEAGAVAESQTGEVAKKRSWKERGMATVEYALGILCAAAVVLVVLRVINDNAFFTAVSQWIYGMISNLLNIGK